MIIIYFLPAIKYIVTHSINQIGLKREREMSEVRTVRIMFSNTHTHTHNKLITIIIHSIIDHNPYIILFYMNSVLILMFEQISQRQLYLYLSVYKFCFFLKNTKYMNRKNIIGHLLV